MLSHGRWALSARVLERGAGLYFNGEVLAVVDRWCWRWAFWGGILLGWRGLVIRCLVWKRGAVLPMETQCKSIKRSLKRALGYEVETQVTSACLACLGLGQKHQGGWAGCGNSSHLPTGTKTDS